MINKSKRYRENLSLYDKNKTYNINDALTILKDMPSFNFDESIDMSVFIYGHNSSTSAKKKIMLPHGNGKKIKILLLIKDGDSNLSLMNKYNVDYIGGHSLIKKIESKMFDLNYNYIIATPDMLSYLKPIAAILGPKNLMPNSKNETITTNIKQTVEDLRRGRMYIAPNKNGSLNLSIGRKSFKNEWIHDNFETVHKLLKNLEHASKKKQCIHTIFLSSTMSSGIKIRLD